MGEPLLGLHPIIREFIRTSFPKSDREKYVGTILGFLDRMIGRFKNLLPHEPSYEILEHWTRKADLQITFRKFEEATSTIQEISQPLIDRGYSEEMIRLTMRLLEGVDWAEACSSYRDFDSIFGACLNEMIQIGHDASDDLLTRYEAAIPGKSSQFIFLCDLRCYADWYSGEYHSAIRWGEMGERLKEKSHVDTGFSTKHNLALARRDAGLLSEAIDSFLDGESLEVVVTPGRRIQGKEAHFYGNIGRCLFLADRLDEALACYAKSAQLLEDSRSHRNRLNKGYIRLWIGELLVQQGKYELAAALYRAAVCIWEEGSPPRSRQAQEGLMALATEHPELRTYLDRTEWEAEEDYGHWLRQQ